MAETKTPVSNLGVSAQSKTQSMVQFLSGLEQDRTEINGGQYDAAIAFLETKVMMFKPVNPLLMY